MWHYVFYKDLLERAVRSTAWTLLSVYFVGDKALDAFSIDWKEAAGIGLGSALLSALGSLAGSQVSPLFAETTIRPSLPTSGAGPATTRSSREGGTSTARV